MCFSLPWIVVIVTLLQDLLTKWSWSSLTKAIWGHRYLCYLSIDWSKETESFREIFGMKGNICLTCITSSDFSALSDTLYCTLALLPASCRDVGTILAHEAWPKLQLNDLNSHSRSVEGKWEKTLPFHSPDCRMSDAIGWCSVLCSLCVNTGIPNEHPSPCYIIHCKHAVRECFYDCVRITELWQASFPASVPVRPQKKPFIYYMRFRLYSLSEVRKEENLLAALAHPGQGPLGSVYAKIEFCRVQGGCCYGGGFKRNLCKIISWGGPAAGYSMIRVKGLSSGCRSN